MEMRSNKNIRIGDVLQELGYINEDQINQAVAYQKENKGVRLGAALIALGFITEKQMLEALGKRLNYEVVNISDLSVDVKAVEMIPRVLAEKYNMMGYKVEDTMYYLLVDDPLNFYGIEDIRQIVGREVHISLCEKAPLENSIQYYYSEVSARQAAQKASANTTQTSEVMEISVEEGDDDTPIINLFNSLLVRAYNSNASDIHIEPFENHTSVRMRMDGVICDFMTLQKNIHNSLLARIKILGDLDIAERRIPQDGHFRINIEGVNLNVRVSVIPTVFGEKAVLRLLASAGSIDHMGTFGMTDRNYKLVMRMLQSPNGIIYLTGPTGSGKSTTLYMILEELAKRSVNISTIEDPVEKNVPKLNQMQVNNTAGLTFEVGLRALLRQDPDIICVGEIRDGETAGIAVQAAITGHLVVSTLHTNSAASTITRLIDMGIESYIAGDAVVGVIAQRLVRRLCTTCKQPRLVEDDERVQLGVPADEEDVIIYEPQGCPLCNDTGYSGRIGVYEMMPVSRELQAVIASGATADVIEKQALKEGMLTLKMGAAKHVLDGITSIAEMNKIVHSTVTVAEGVDMGEL